MSDSTTQETTETTIILRIDKNHGIRGLKIYGIDRKDGFKFLEQITTQLDQLDEASRQYV